METISPWFLHLKIRLFIERHGSLQLWSMFQKLVIRKKTTQDFLMSKCHKSVRFLVLWRPAWAWLSRTALAPEPAKERDWAFFSCNGFQAVGGPRPCHAGLPPRATSSSILLAAGQVSLSLTQKGWAFWEDQSVASEDFSAHPLMKLSS